MSLIDNIIKRSGAEDFTDFLLSLQLDNDKAKRFGECLTDEELELLSHVVVSLRKENLNEGKKEG